MLVLNVGTTGIRNTTTVFDNPERDRVRAVRITLKLRCFVLLKIFLKARLIPHDGVLRVCHFIHECPAPLKSDTVVFFSRGYWAVMDEGSE